MDLPEMLQLIESSREAIIKTPNKFIPLINQVIHNLKQQTGSKFSSLTQQLETLVSLIPIIIDRGLVDSNQMNRYIDTLIQGINNANNPMANQSWFIDRMDAVGYKVNKEGACFGMSHMSMQAFLAGDMQTFKNRLEFICNIPIDDFKNDFLKLREKQKQFIKDNQKLEADRINQRVVDILSFFDGISLYQNTINYSHLFENTKTLKKQDSEKTREIVIPVSLDSNNYRPVRINTHAGAYTEKELELYLATLERHLGENSFALILSSVNHAININYDSHSKSWLLIDPNDLPGKEYKDTNLLSNALLCAYGLNEVLVMASDIYTTTNHAVNMQVNFLSMKETSEWRSIYDVSKINTIDARNLSQLFYAILRGDNDWIQDMLSFGLKATQTDLSLACFSNMGPDVWNKIKEK